jgi:hypothetical protein
LTTDADTTRTTAVVSATADPAHVAALEGLRTQADKIRYACEQIPEPDTAQVQQWLATYRIRPDRSHMSKVVNHWRGSRNLASTGEMPKLTPEMLAELDSDLDSLTGSFEKPQPVTAQPMTAKPAAVASRAPEPVAQTRPEPVRAERPVRPRGWLVAWLSFVVGGLVSVAANIAHTLYPTAAQLATWTAAGNAADTWAPSPGAMAFAAFWPIALILSVEVITRVTWRPGFLFGLARYGGTTLVAAVAAVMSYRHMAGLLAIWGEDVWGAHLGPLAVDGLMVVAAAALLTMSRTEKPS